MYTATRWPIRMPDLMDILVCNIQPQIVFEPTWMCGGAEDSIISQIFGDIITHRF